MKVMVNQADNANKAVAPTTITPRICARFRLNHKPNNIITGMTTNNVNMLILVQYTK